MKQINVERLETIVNDTISLAGNNHILDEYESGVRESALYPGKNTFVGLMYTVLKLCGETGEVAEKIGKLIRDEPALEIEVESDMLNRDRISMKSPYKWPAAALTEIQKELGDVLWYWVAIHGELDISLDQTIIGNLEKLLDRAKRNQLQGSGDKR